MVLKVDPVAERLMLISVSLLLFVNILVLILYRRVNKASSERLTMELAIQKEKAEAEYYYMLKEQYEHQRILIHDIQHHLQAIAELATENNSLDISEYVEQIIQEPALKNKIRICGDPILNAILVRYHQRCKNHEITFICDVRENSVDMLSVTEMTTIFGNLLANSFEAARQSQERLIELSIVNRREQEHTVITLVNSCDIPLKVNGIGEIITNKEDMVNHGVGLRSVKRVVKRMNGSLEMHYDDEEKRFHAIIVISGK